MSGGMPELGSRISLISKADIRYEGRLFTVDPQECTIALAGVQSFGTEDRETACPIAPQSQIYEYILFRGSDIKDIRVINNCTIPNDPAIMQMHLPSQGPLLQSPYHTPGFSVPNPIHGNVAPPVNTFNQLNPHSAFGKLGSSQNIVSDIQGKPPMKPYDILESSDLTADPKGISRSASPVVASGRRSPTAEATIQAPKPSNKNHSQNNQRNEAAGNENQQRMNKHQQGGNRNYDGNRHYDGNRNYDMNNQHRQWNNRNNAPNSRNRYRGRPQGSFNPQMRGQGNRGRNVLKFDNDYDFEQANNKFEELRSQLSKIKISEENKLQQNGEVEKKEDSGNETGTGEAEQEDDETGYDKTKSFFDNISCEAIERSKGKTQRTDWRQEKKLNTETFGVSSNRRSNFRSRGGFNRNYNRNANFRDDYRGRPGNNRPNQGFGSIRNSEPIPKNN